MEYLWVFLNFINNNFTNIQRQTLFPSTWVIGRFSILLVITVGVAEEYDADIWIMYVVFNF